ncbi:MAG: XRE family transcriptional regulator [Pseudoruegeria sp.]
MIIEQKESLSMHGDMGLKASAIRLLAARLFTEIPTQNGFAKACDVGATTYNNMEKALNYPNRKVMKYLYRGHRIDFNFLMNGDFSQLPEDVQNRLFEKLRIAHDEWDQKAN